MNDIDKQEVVDLLNRILELNWLVLCGIRTIRFSYSAIIGFQSCHGYANKLPNLLCTLNKRAS